MHTTGSVTRLIHALDDAYPIHPDDYGDDYPLDPITLAVLRAAWNVAHREANRADIDPCEVILLRDPDYVAMIAAEDPDRLTTTVTVHPDGTISGRLTTT